MAGDTLIIEVEFRDDDNNIIDHVNYDITATQDGEVILSEPKSHRHPGMHPIHETSILGESEIEIKVVLQGLGHGEDITEPIGVETVMSLIPEIPIVEVSEPETIIIAPSNSSTYSNACLIWQIAFIGGFTSWTARPF